MRVGPSKASSEVKKSGAAKSSGGPGAAGFSLDPVSQSPGTASSAGTTRAEAVAALDALLDLQSVAADGKGTALRQGRQLLSMMADLQREVLEGRVSRQRLRALSNVAAAKKKSSSADLDGVLDQIALRARVELAKLGE